MSAHPLPELEAAGLCASGLGSVALAWTPGDGTCNPTRFLHGRIQEQHSLPNIDMKPASPELLPTGLILSAGALKQHNKNQNNDNGMYMT